MNRESQEFNFLRFLARVFFISFCGIILSIPIINIIYLDYFWSSKENKDILKELFFGSEVFDDDD